MTMFVGRVAMKDNMEVSMLYKNDMLEKVYKDKIAELTCDCKSDLKHLGSDYHQAECRSVKVLEELYQKWMDDNNIVAIAGDA